MSEPTPPPPGWYPVSQHKQRYFDGTEWTEHVAPLGGQPVPHTAPPKKSGGTLVWVLVTIGLLFVLAVGGCGVFLAAMGGQQERIVDDISRQLETTAP